MLAGLHRIRFESSKETAPLTVALCCVAARAKDEGRSAVVKPCPPWILWGYHF